MTTQPRPEANIGAAARAGTTADQHGDTRTRTHYHPPSAGSMLGNDGAITNSDEER